MNYIEQMSMIDILELNESKILISGQAF
jgi:hypothetical protein